MNSGCMHHDMRENCMPRARACNGSALGDKIMRNHHNKLWTTNAYQCQSWKLISNHCKEVIFINTSPASQGAPVSWHSPSPAAHESHFPAHSPATPKDLTTEQTVMVVIQHIVAKLTAHKLAGAFGIEEWSETELDLLGIQFL